MKRLALALLLPLAKAGSWLLDTQLDAYVCKPSNDLSGDDDA